MNEFGPGSKVGSYVLDAYIGGGSFGAVWRGHHEENAEPVAIKLLNGALSGGDSASLRADVEVLAAAAAGQSANIVRVLGGGLNPVPHIVMEFIEGENLQAVLKDGAKLSIDRTTDIAISIADALRALNDVGIIHRDIKPANVMIDEAGTVKLADFGIAKIVGYETITMTGQAAMTMAYAAPEMWDEGTIYGSPSHKSDLYALGILLYQCLTGVTPFYGNYGALYKAHLERPPDLDILPADTPPSLRMVIRRCLEKRQDDRPLSANECSIWLRRARAEIALSEGTLADREPSRFGPWLKDAPHRSLPWAWSCHHETRDDVATVEVHFADNLSYGSRLRTALVANPALTTFGAERLIESNRLLLHPNEVWVEPPPGQFQFWVAREDLKVAPAVSVTEPLLRAGASALAALIEAAKSEGVPLDLSRENLTIREDGEIYLRRAGLRTQAGTPDENGLAYLRSLPLDGQARRLLDSSSDFEPLLARSGRRDEEASLIAAPTQLVVRPDEKTTLGKASLPSTQVVGPPLPRAKEPLSSPAAAPSAPVSVSAPAKRPNWLLPLGIFGALGVVALLLVMVLKSGGGSSTPVAGLDAAAQQPSPTAAGSAPGAAPSAPVATEIPAVPAIPPVAAPAVVVESAPADRTSCAEIRGTSYKSPAERDWFLANCGAPAPATSGVLSAGTAPIVTVPATVPTAIPAPALAAPAPPPAAAPSVATTNFNFVGFSDHTGPGNFAPSDAVPSGGTLRSCNPSSLYAFVNFSSLQPPKQFVGSWTLNGAFLNQQSLSETVTNANTFWQVQNSPTALNAGSYTFQISVDGSIVSQGRFNLSC